MISSIIFMSGMKATLTLLLFRYYFLAACKKILFITTLMHRYNPPRIVLKYDTIFTYGGSITQSSSL